MEPLIGKWCKCSEGDFHLFKVRPRNSNISDLQIYEVLYKYRTISLDPARCSANTASGLESLIKENEMQSLASDRKTRRNGRTTV